jgi:hypothetical protein
VDFSGLRDPSNKTFGGQKKNQRVESCEIMSKVLPPIPGKLGHFMQSSVSGCRILYLIHFALEICHFFLEILHTFTGIFLRVFRSEYSFSDGGTFLS